MFDGARASPVPPPRAARAASSDHPRGDRGTEKARRGVPHSGYHRTVGARRPFFEGWYFRVTLPEARDNLSLIYHVYDPDLRDSPRRAAGARVHARGRVPVQESQDVDAFAAAPHAPRAVHADGTPERRGVVFGGGFEERFFLEFFEVSDDGRRHRGCLVASATREDESIWPSAKRVGARRVGLFRLRPGGLRRERRRGLDAQIDGGVAERVAGLRAALSDPHGARARDRPRDRGRREDGVRERPRVRREELGGAGFPSKWFWTQCNAFPSAPGVSVTATGANRGWCSCPACARRWPGSSYTSRSRRVRTRAGQTGKQTRKPARRRAPSRCTSFCPSAPAARSPRRSRGASRRGDRGASPRRPPRTSAWCRAASTRRTLGLETPPCSARPWTTTGGAWSRAAASPSAAA